MDANKVRPSRNSELNLSSSDPKVSASFTIVIESDESDEQPELLEAIFEDEDNKTTAEVQTDDDTEPSDAADETTDTVNEISEASESTDTTNEEPVETSEDLASAE